MKQIWFKRTGWFYLPVHFMGLFVTLAAIVFMLPVCFAITKGGHSVADDLYKIFVYSSCTGFWWKWIADKTSEK
jgi:hypothetical protein